MHSRKQTLNSYYLQLLPHHQRDAASSLCSNQCKHGRECSSTRLHFYLHSFRLDNRISVLHKRSYLLNFCIFCQIVYVFCVVGMHFAKVERRNTCVEFIIFFNRFMDIHYRKRYVPAVLGCNQTVTASKKDLSVQHWDICQSMGQRSLFLVLFHYFALSHLDWYQQTGSRRADCCYINLIIFLWHSERLHRTADV